MTMPSGYDIVSAFGEETDAFMPGDGGDLLATLFLAKRGPGVDGEFPNGEQMLAAYMNLVAEGVEGFGEGNVRVLQVTVMTEPQTEISPVQVVPLTPT